MLKRLGIALLTASAFACSGNGGRPDVGPRISTSAALKSFDSCKELAEKLRDNLRQESRAMLLQYLDDRWYYGYPARGGMEGDVPAAAADNSAAGDTGRQEGVDYSGTNNQESGVDEGDFVKTDGYHIYVLDGNSLAIIGVPQFGQLTSESTIAIEGYPREMLVAGDTVVVFSQIYPSYIGVNHPLYANAVFADGHTWRVSELTKMTFVNVSDHANPTTTRELYIEGWYQTSRKIDTSVRVISYAQINLWDLTFYPQYPNYYWQLDWRSDEARKIREQAVYDAIAKNDAIIAKKPLSDFIPNIYERNGKDISVHNFADAECSSFGIADDSLGRGVTSVVSFDVAGKGYEADHVISNSSVVYASKDTLIVAEASWNWWWYYGQDDVDDSTNLHRFDISTAGVTRYTGSGRVSGIVTDQFNLSEKAGVVRVATTSNQWGRWWVQNPPPVSSNVFTLWGDNALSVVGEVSGISPGERLWATRFVDDTAYLVTFRNMDPLWTVDLSDPLHPAIQSALEVSGVSTYVHPLVGGRLLSLGIAGTATGGLDWGTTQVSLYDVSQPTAPSLTAALQLGLPDKNSWSYSEAQYQHKAFTYFEPKKTLAVPLSSWGYDYTLGYRYYSALELVSVSADGLASAGHVDHTLFFNDPTHYWENPGIRRSIFMGDYIVAISQRGITATHLGDLVLTASVPLPGDDTPYWFY